MLDLSSIPDVTQELGSSELLLLRDHLHDEIRRAERNPLRWGIPPHEGQEELHCSEADHVLLIAANRWGKSWALLREALWRATGTHPYKRLRPHEVIWVGFPDFPFYTKVTKRIFDYWCPPEYLLDFNQSEKWAKFRREDGGECTMFFLSYESGREKWQGGAVDCVLLDEEHPEEIYSEALARLINRRGTMIQGLTPVSGMGWIYDRIYLPAKQGRKKNVHVIEGALAEYDETRPYGIGRIRVPHLDYQQVRRFAEEIPDEDERAIRIFGQFRARSGTVYKQFDDSVHVIEPFEIPPHWEIWGAADPGYHGFSVLLFAQCPQGRIYVAREVFSQQESIEARFEAIEAAYESMRPAPSAGAEPMVIFVDTEDPQAVLEYNLAASEAGKPIAFASLDQGLKARLAGITRVQRQLQQREGREKPQEVLRAPAEQGEPLLYFFADLGEDLAWREGENAHKGESRVLWEIGRYLWKKPKRGSTVQPDDADEDSAGGAHALAALRYGIMARMGPPEEKEERPAGVSAGAQWVWDHMREMEEEVLAETEHEEW